VAEIVIVGVGPGPVELLTGEAREALDGAERVFFRYGTHPVAKMLLEAGKDVVSFERLYADGSMSYADVYKLIVGAVVKEARLKGRVIFALPGNPYVFEKTPRWIEEELERSAPEVRLRIIPGLSFLEILYPLLGVDPEEGLLILNAARLVEEPGRYPSFAGVACIIGQVGLPTGGRPTGGKTNFAELVEIVGKEYRFDHRAVLVRCLGYPDFATEKVETVVGGLAGCENFVNNLTSLYLPPVSG